MPSNLDRYKKDLDCLIERGGNLLNAMQTEKKVEPTPEQVNGLVDGVMKITKTVF
jgi:hypothetical protein